MEQNTLVRDASRDDASSHGDDTHGDDFSKETPSQGGDTHEDASSQGDDADWDDTDDDDTDEDDAPKMLYTDDTGSYRAPVTIGFPGLVGCLAFVHVGKDGCVYAHHISGAHLSCLMNHEHRAMFMMIGQAGLIEIEAAEEYKTISEEFRKDHPGETYMCGPNMDSVAQAAYNIPATNMDRTEDGPVTAIFNTETKSWTWKKD